jgi:hypothetical protein
MEDGEDGREGGGARGSWAGGATSDGTMLANRALEPQAAQLSNQRQNRSGEVSVR